MPRSEYEDDEVEKLYDTNEEILEEDGKGDIKSMILGDWNSIVGDQSEPHHIQCLTRWKCDVKSLFCCHESFH
jgi:hypothetical protein